MALRAEKSPGRNVRQILPIPVGKVRSRNGRRLHHGRRSQVMAHQTLIHLASQLKTLNGMRNRRCCQRILPHPTIGRLFLGGKLRHIGLLKQGLGNQLIFKALRHCHYRAKGSQHKCYGEYRASEVGLN